MIRDNLHVEDYLSEGKRFDDRKLDQFRKIVIDKGVVDNAEGSCRVRIGNTDVICGVKLEPGEPYPDTPDEGALIVNAEFSPISSPDFEPGRPTEDAVELARVVDRGIRESKAIDMKKLCITKGEKVWMLFVDISIVNDDGNLMDASFLSALGALENTKVPTFVKKDGSVNRSKTTPLKLLEKPVEVSVSKVNNHLFLDPSREEEEVVTARLTVASTDKKLCAMQKSGSGYFTEEELFSAIELALEKAKELRKLV